VHLCVRRKSRRIRGGLFFLAPHPVDLIESERKKNKIREGFALRILLSRPPAPQCRLILFLPSV